MALFRLIKKPLTREREEKIQATGVMFLMALIILVTIADVGKLLK
jgi:membrane-associated protease RseP (regulator of RpoE activity)